MQVSLVDKMGSDLTVVNAARVSFAKESEWDTITPSGKTPGLLQDKDERLIKYLATHEHWSPFAHCTLQFRIKAPVFVARQLVKHQVGLAWNEVSRRYVDDDPEFFIPDNWRLKAEDKKQGSSNEAIEFDVSELIGHACDTYDRMLEANIAPEMARMVLPQNMMTEWYWSGTLYAFARVCNLRCADDTQAETRVVADLIDELTEQEFPISWKYLRNDKK